ncbi:M20 family metallopeptidase [Paralimibaculum aggregatum]|uniref:M20 family metallopeptidase n=1 Tax=Paralimibaculum aggregatum TaxID=3036245 RepID=A0ABQ6LKF8_9RHOB|nr:M20 family metallopeptidase [Limibaculum sp. NKW23]GMG83730.1 M20 family metallopeptidase [Limibaculum sp. NKW23]
MQMPDEREILAGLRDWVEIETPTGYVAGINRLMDMVAGQFAALGAEIERIPGRDGQGDHLSVALPWSGPAETPGLLVLCHLDTVHAVGSLASMPFRVEGDRAYGPGIADMKGGVYIAYRAARALVEAGAATPLPLRFLLTSDEETGSATSRALIEAAADRAAYVLVTEPARSGGKIVTGRRGLGRYRLTTRGRPAHSGTNHATGRSAIREMARQVLAIEAMTDYDRGVTLNVGQIHGGTSDNTVPEHCTAGVDLRADSNELLTEMDARLRALAPEDPDVTLNLTGGPNRPAYRKTPEIAALFEHAKGLAAEAGWVLEDLHTGGGSDGSFVAGRVPTLDGLGVDGAAAHTPDEHLFVSSLVPRMVLLRRLMETLGG